MIRALALLLTCQLAGEVASRASGLPVPGPVMGLALLATLLSVQARWMGKGASAIATSEVGITASRLLGTLGLLFVPAGVGIVQQSALIWPHLIAIFTSLLVSTMLTLVVTVYVFLGVKAWMARSAGSVSRD